MVFSSLTFLYFFLPCVIVSYFLFPGRAWRSGVLLVFSLLFYSWGEPKYVVLMLLAAAVAYVGGRLMDKLSGRPGPKRVVFVITVVLLVGNLVIFKYLNFLCDNLGIAHPQIALPIGISFYTFQILSYVIDLYWGKIAVQRNFWLLLLYVSFFPQLIAGPIVRYQTIEREIASRRESWDGVVSGLRRFLVGLGKKVLLANQVAQIADLVYGGDPAVYGTAGYWLAALAYTLQIYFDFSGYSDMAIGLGRIFGFHFLENFDHPYISRSITEFWRRWHISLSTWFRDYIYIPLGGSRTGTGRWILNLCIVWGLTGIWHGAAWNFFFWGLYYAVLLVLEKFVLGGLLERLPNWVRWGYAMFFVVIGWVFFNLTDVTVMTRALHMMFSAVPTDWQSVIAANSSILILLPWIPIAMVCCLPLPKKFRPARTLPGVLLTNGIYGCLLLVCIFFLLSSSYNPFIYFRF